MEEHSTIQRAVAEIIGTALLVFVGAGSVPAILLLEGGTKAPFSGADVFAVATAFGLVVVAMAYTVGKVSGCHINPAVTFALAVTKRFPWREVPLYWVSQLVGGVLGGLAMWATFGQRGIDLGYGFGVVNFNHDVTSWGSAMFAEAIGTAILMFTILGIVDSRSPAGWAGLVIGLVIVAIIITVGPVTNASLNPARAIGTLFTEDVAGGVHNWTKQFGAYIPANLFGAAFAAILYDWVAKPRLVQRPVHEALTEPDRAAIEAV